MKDNRVMMRYFELVTEPNLSQALERGWLIDQMKLWT